jgi:hypothetical protein
MPSAAPNAVAVINAPFGSGNDNAMAAGSVLPAHDSVAVPRLSSAAPATGQAGWPRPPRPPLPGPVRPRDRAKFRSMSQAHPPLLKGTPTRGGGGSLREISRGGWAILVGLYPNACRGTPGGECGSRRYARQGCRRRPSACVLRVILLPERLDAAGTRGAIPSSCSCRGVRAEIARNGSDALPVGHQPCASQSVETY